MAEGVHPADPDQARLGRARWLRPSELDEEQRRVYESVTTGPRASSSQVLSLTDADGRLNGPFNGMLFNPAVGDAVQSLGAALRWRTGLSKRAREIAILEVARARQSEFEWYAHVRLGVAAGLDPAEIEAVRTGGDLELPPSEAIVRQVALALLEAGDLDEELFARAEAELGAATLGDLVYLVGYYDLLALSMRVWRTPLPTGAATTWATKR